MTASVRKFGFELEYSSGAEAMVRTLNRGGLMQMDYLHDYHCTCRMCRFTESAGHHDWDPDHECDGHCSDYGCWNEDDHRCGRRNCPRLLQTQPGTGDPPPDLRAQRDSTADGEFISRPITEWDDFHRIVNALTEAASAAGAGSSSRCGLHVHVDTSDDILVPAVEGSRYAEFRPQREQRRRTVPAAYLAFERYFDEIVAPGASIRKREMNTTLMQAARQYISDSYGVVQPRRTGIGGGGPFALTGGNDQIWLDWGRSQVDDTLSQVIGRDRHVDLNWNNRHGTWEFRAFNATNAAWRIELACRLSVAFVEATPQLREMVENVVRGSKFWPDGCDSPWGEIIRPAFSELPAPHPTKRPIVPLADFIDALCAVDAALRPLIERQANFMRTRYARQVEPAS